MQVYKLVMRRSILAYIVEELRSTTDLEFPGGERALERISTYEINALLYARRNQRVDALRSALQRLEHGTFGVCRKCRARITWSTLLRDPRRTLCTDCELEPGTDIRNVRTTSDLQH